MTDSNGTAASGAGPRSRRALLGALTATALGAAAGCNARSASNPNGSSTHEGSSAASQSSTETTSAAAVSDPPTTGDRVPELAPVEDPVRTFVVQRNVPAAALAVARDGDLLLERGFGWRDQSRTEPTPPDARFRIASITKGMTTAAIDRLVEAGDVSMDTAAFPALGVEPLPGDSKDPRIDEITVEHLLNHRGGLGPMRPVAPILGVASTFEMAEEMDLSAPPSTRQRVRYMLGQSPQFDPGEKRAYSNFGYAVLGLLVAESTGTPFPEYVHSTLLEGEGVLYEGRTRPEDRRESEVDYFSQRTKPNVIDLERNERVPIPDGGFHLEAAGGAGELVSNARTLLKFADRYLLTGELREGDPEEPLALFGSLSGTLTLLLQHPEADVAVLLNRRNPLTFRSDLQALREDLKTAVEGIDRWP